ncbi:MAG: hypothetical protein ABJP34_03280 [Erythrobacter sp.]
MIMVLIAFLLGVGNFALHKAVLESGHPLLGQMPSFVQSMGGRASLIMEFVILVAAMLLVWNGWPAVLWGYFAYTAFNGLSAWLILSGKI